MPDTRDHPFVPEDERLLERAVNALRDAPVPPGPLDELQARTVSAVRVAQARGLRAGRFRPFGAASKLAAAFAIVATLVGAYALTHRSVTVVIPAPQPSPSTLVKGDPKTPGSAVATNQRTPMPAPGSKLPPAAPGGQLGSEIVMASDSIDGTVLFVGIPPARAPIDMSAVAECRARHPQGGLDDTVIVTGDRLSNVVVSVEPLLDQDLLAMAPAEDAPRDPVVLDQHDCRFVPHVLAGMVGQELLVKNSDPFLHNVHSRAKSNERFNIGQPSVDPGRTVNPLAATERFQIRCDIHPWMSAVVNVFEHPYFAVSAEDGSFSITTKGLKDGDYTLLAWHETLGERRAIVHVHDGEAGKVEFRFNAVAAMAPNASPRPVMVAKVLGSADGECAACQK